MSKRLQSIAGLSHNHIVGKTVKKPNTEDTSTALTESFINSVLDKYLNDDRYTDITDGMKMLQVGRSKFYAMLNDRKKINAEAAEKEVPVTYSSLSIEYKNQIFAQFTSKSLDRERAMKLLGLGSSQFYNHLGVYNLNKGVISSEKSFVSDSVADEIRKEVSKRTLGGANFGSKSEFVKFMTPFVRKTWKEAGRNNWDIEEFRPSDSWINTNLKIFLPEFGSQADKQNAARAKKRMDIFVSLQQAFVSYAALMGPTGLLWPHDRLGIQPSLLFSIDTFTQKLQDGFAKNHFRTGAGAKALAKASHLGIKGGISGVEDSVNLISEDEVAHLEAQLMEARNRRRDRENAAKENKTTTAANTQNAKRANQQKQMDAMNMKILAENLEQGYDPDTEFPPTGDGDERSDDDGQDTDISSTNIVDAALVLDIADRLKELHLLKPDQPSAAICEVPGTKVSSREFQCRTMAVEAMTNARSELIMALFIIKERNCKNPILQSLSASKGMWMLIRPPTLSPEENLALARRRFQICVLPAIERERNRVIADRRVNLECQSSRIPSATTSIAIAPEEDDTEMYRCLLTQDGCGVELKVITTYQTQATAPTELVAVPVADAAAAANHNDVIIVANNAALAVDDLAAGDLSDMHPPATSTGDLAAYQLNEGPEDSAKAKEQFTVPGCLIGSDILPVWLMVMKHFTQSTALFQANDVAKCHSTMNALVQRNTHTAVEGRDDGCVPTWYEVAGETLKEGGVVGASRRTYMKYLASVESNLKHAFSYLLLEPGWRKSAQWPWNLRSYLKRYSGYQYLTKDDFLAIEEAMWPLVQIAYGTGTITREQMESFMHDWCLEINIKCTSLIGRYLLVTEQLKGNPIDPSTSNIANMGAVILTHPTFLAHRRTTAQSLAQGSVAKMHQVEIDRVEESRKDEEVLQHTRVVVNAAKYDLQLGVFDNVDEQCTWRKCLLATTKSAYKRLVPDEAKPKPQPTNKIGYQNVLSHFLKTIAQSEIDYDIANPKANAAAAMANQDL